MEEFLSSLFLGNPFWGTLIASMVPIIEVRGAIPFALSHDLWETPLSLHSAILASIIGSCVMVMILLLITYPLCKKLKNFKIIANFIEKLENKVKKTEKNNKIITDNKKSKYILLSFFTMVPLPLTGYYSACLIASFCGFKKINAFISILIGNIICILIISFISSISSEYVNYIFYFFLICFIIISAYFIFDTIIKIRKK